MVKLGIVGWGYWGRNYAKYLDNSIDATLEWVCGARPEMLQDAKKCYPHFKITTDYKDLVKNKVDGVIIATPATSHVKLAEYFIKNNTNLLIEKPLATSTADALHLLKLSEECKVKILVGLTFLYNSTVRWLKEKIDKNYFGKIYFLEFKRQSYGPIRDDVNIVWDFAPHDIAIATWLLNNKLPVNVYVKAKRFSRHKQEDIAVIALEYPNNILVNINVAWLYPLKMRSMVLLGNKKMAIFDDANILEPLKIYNTSLHYPSEKEPYRAAFRLGDVVIPRVHGKDPLYTELKHFVDVIKGKEDPITSVLEGIKNVALLEAMNLSLIKNKEVVFEEYLKDNPELNQLLSKKSR